MLYSVQYGRKITPRVVDLDIRTVGALRRCRVMCYVREGETWGYRQGEARSPEAGGREDSRVCTQNCSGSNF